MMQLKLDTTANGSKTVENLVELNLEELNSLLASLKAAQQVHFKIAFLLHNDF